MDVPIPDVPELMVPQAQTENIITFRNNMILLFHNKYREGIPLGDITTLYKRYFHKYVIPSTISPGEMTWEEVIRKEAQLKVFKTDRSNTKLTLIKNYVRNEQEMLAIAELFRFANPDPENLFHFVVKHYRNLPAHDKLKFKSRIEPFLNSDGNDALVPNSDIMDHEGPLLGNNIFLPAVENPLATSFGANSSSQLLEELLGTPNPTSSYNLDPSLPVNSEQLNSNGGGGGNKRKTPMSNSQNVAEKSSEDVPEKRFKSANNVSTTAITTNENSAPYINVSTSTIHHKDSNGSLQRANEAVMETVQTENDAAVNNIQNIAQEEYERQETNRNQEDMNGLSTEPDSGLLVDNNNILEDVVDNDNVMNTESALNGTADSASSVSESTCDLPIRPCDKDKYIVPTEFDFESDSKLSPDDWVVFQLTEDDLGYYKGRQKNCNPKYFEQKSRKWELYSKKERNLRLPNNMVVYGEFEEENGKTVFEIIDCTEDNSGSSIKSQLFSERYKAGKIVSDAVPNGINVHGVSVGQKPYVSLENFLDCQATDGCTKGTLLFIHKRSFGFIKPKIIRYDNQNPLSELLRKIILWQPTVNMNGDNGNPNFQRGNSQNHVPMPNSIILSRDQENNSSVDDFNAIADQNEQILENFVCDEIASSLRPKVKDLSVLKRILKEFKSVIVNVKSIRTPPTPDRSYGFRPATYEPHKCAPGCLTKGESRSMIPGLISTTNPLNLCRMYRWQRKGIDNIEYVAPCLITLKTYKEVTDYLLRTDFSRITDPPLFIDYFSFETDIRDWVELPVWPNILIGVDISNKQEVREITCVNEIDHERLPVFEYIKEMIRGENVDFPLHDVDNRCECSSDQCEINTATTRGRNNQLCDCVEATQILRPTQREPSRFASRLKGYDFRRLFLPVTPGIFECNSKCKCDQYCGNRVSQSDIKWKLQVFRKSNDWGLRTLHDIPKGHFVCRFVGKVVLQPEAAQGEERYQIKLGPTFYCPYQSSKKTCSEGESPHLASQPKSTKKTRRAHTCPKRFDGQILYIDATHQGNVGRFIDHSSRPNAFIQIAYVDDKSNKSNFNVAIFTKENIYAGNEITVDFTTWRGGLSDNTRDSVSSRILNRPGPKGSKGDSQGLNQGSSTANRDSNRDTLSQGSSNSQSSTKSSSCSSTLIVRLEKITSVESTLKEHKLHRRRKNSNAGGNGVKKEVATDIKPVIKTELGLVIEKISTPANIVELEIKKEIMTEKEGGENDNPADSVDDLESNVSGSVSDVVVLPPPPVEERQIEIIELASSPEPEDPEEERVDLVSDSDVLSIVTPVSSRLRSQSMSQPVHPATSSDTPSTSRGVSESRPSSSQPTWQQSLNNSQQSPDAGYSGYANQSDYIDYSQHEVSDCMKHCTILNESGFPSWVCKNKLFSHQVHGFKRKLVNRTTVVYETACENRYASNKEIFEFLKEAMLGETRLGLAIDNFCFDPTIDCGFLLDIARSSDVYIVAEDISNGSEIVPIRCVSTHAGLEPERFRYISTYEISEQCKRSCGITGPDFAGCECRDGCMHSSMCSCGRGKKFGDYSSKSVGYNYRQLFNPQPYGIIECGSICSCADATSLCINRVAQNDFAWRVEIFNTERTGWGVRTLQDIPKGAFVCNYVGMLKSPNEAHTGDPQYQALVMHPRIIQGVSKITEKRNNILIIDATKEGNLARFINHSCSPNLFVQEVFFGPLGEGHFCKHMPTIALFSNQNISSNTELTMDYQHLIEDPANTDIACMCRTMNCRETFLQRKP